MIKLNGKDDKSMITVEDFKKIPLNEMVLLTSKVSFIKFLKMKMNCIFTYLQAGGKYGIHSHDCNEYNSFKGSFD
jgi:hypothetical protein